MTRPASNNQPAMSVEHLDDGDRVVEQLIRSSVQREFRSSEPSTAAWQRLRYQIAASQPLTDLRSGDRQTAVTQPVALSPRLQLFGFPRLLMQNMLAVLLVVLIAAPAASTYLLGHHTNPRQAQSNMVVQPNQPHPVRPSSVFFSAPQPASQVEIATINARLNEQVQAAKAEEVEQDWLAEMARTASHSQPAFVSQSSEDASESQDYIHVRGTAFQYR